MSAVLDDLERKEVIRCHEGFCCLQSRWFSFFLPVFSCIAVVKQAEIPNEMRKTRKIHLLKSEEVQ